MDRLFYDVYDDDGKVRFGSVRSEMVRFWFSSHPNHEPDPF